MQAHAAALAPIASRSAAVPFINDLAAWRCVKARVAHVREHVAATGARTTRPNVLVTGTELMLHGILARGRSIGPRGD
jgi:hypothetical protein